MGFDVKSDSRSAKPTRIICCMSEHFLTLCLSFKRPPLQSIDDSSVRQNKACIDIFRKQKTTVHSTLNTSRSALLKFLWQECGAVILLHSSAADHPSAALHKHQDQSLPGVKSEYFLHIFLLLLETIVNALHCYSSINPL